MSLSTITPSSNPAAVQWLNSFKSALVGEDLDRIGSLVANYPAQMDIEEMQTAAALIGGALDLFRLRQNELAIELQKAKKARQYSF